LRIASASESLDQAGRSKNYPVPAELQDHEAADERPVERARGEHAEIVDVARLVALITGAIFSARISDSARQTISAGAKGNSLK